MRHILYSAQTKKGRTVFGFIAATSNQNAIQQIEQSGLQQVTLQSDYNFASFREEIDGLSAKEQAKVAQYEISILQNPSLFTTLRAIWRDNFWLTVSGLIMVLLGVWLNWLILICFAPLVMLLFPVLSLYGHSKAAGYNTMLRQYAKGDWPAVLAYCSKHRHTTKFEQLAFDLDIRHASILANQGQLDQGLALIAPWQHKLDDSGMFEMRQASVYWAAGQPEQFLATMQQGFERSDQSASLRLDLALAHARVGDIEVSKTLLQQVDLALLPDYAAAFVHWVHGLVLAEPKSSAAQLKLAQAVSAFMPLANNPAIWPSLAVCIGDFALSIEDQKNVDMQRLLPPIWPILKIHGQADITAQIAQRYAHLLG